MLDFLGVAYSTGVSLDEDMCDQTHIDTMIENCCRNTQMTDRISRDYMFAMMSLPNSQQQKACQGALDHS
jgi:hypothetical protein